MTFTFDALVYLSLGALFFVVIAAGVVIVMVPERADMETRKIRFAAATFIAIMLLFVFTASLYFAGETSNAPNAALTIPCGPTHPGKDIFEKAVTAMFTLAGSIVGYLFGSTARNGTTSPKTLV